MKNDSLTVSIAPYIKDKISTRKIMWEVFLALIPAGVAGVFIFGIKSLWVIFVSLVTALASEALILAMRKRDLHAVFDGSAALTGLLLAYNLPPQVPFWIPLAGSFFAIVVGKQVFGGLGHNIFNPALAGRAFLMLSWPIYMTTWPARTALSGWQNPRWACDAVSSATPLAIIKGNEANLALNVSSWDLFIGNRGGCIGEVCIIALLLGALYLFARKYITWHIPLTYLASVALLSWIFNGKKGFFSGEVLFFILSGGLILGAFFMATDYVTSPLGAKGKIIFGFGCGLLTFVIRKFSGYPEGVSYSILIMNAVVPLIDRYTFPKWFGWQKKVVGGR
jgi:electron transport complex protein RnfD